MVLTFDPDDFQQAAEPAPKVGSILPHADGFEMHNMAPPGAIDATPSTSTTALAYVTASAADEQSERGQPYQFLPDAY